MNNCHKYQELMSLYLDNMLSAKEKEEFEKHMESCEECKLELLGLKELMSELNSLPELDLPDGFHQRAMAKIKEGNTKKHAFNFSFRNFAAFAPAAASMAICFVALTWALSSFDLSGGSTKLSYYLESPASEEINEKSAAADALPELGTPAEKAPKLSSGRSEEAAAAPEEDSSSNDLEGNAPFMLAPMESAGMKIQGYALENKETYALVSNSLIKTSSINIKSEDISNAEAFVNSLPVTVESSYVNQYELHYTLRVSSLDYNYVILSLKDLGEVERINENSEDVTGRLNEDITRLNVKQEEKERLKNMFEKAETVSDMLKIEEQVINAEARAEEISASISQLSAQSERPAIYLTVYQEDDTPSYSDLSFGDKLHSAFVSSVNFTSYAFEEILIGISQVILPAIIIALVSFTGYFLFDKRRR